MIPLIRTWWLPIFLWVGSLASLAGCDDGVPLDLHAEDSTVTDSALRDVVPQDARVIHDLAVVPDVTVEVIPELTLSVSDRAVLNGEGIDLGLVEQHAPPIAHVLLLQNTGSGPLSIRILETPPGLLLESDQNPVRLQPGEQIELQVALHTARAMALTDATLRIQTNAPEGERRVGFSGRVRAYVRDVAEPNEPFRLALERIRQTTGLAGLAVAVVQGRDIVALEGAGMANLETEEPVDPRTTRFRWASVSKGLAGIVAVRAADRIDLDASIERYFAGYEVPELYLGEDCRHVECAQDIPAEAQRITLRQLLTHRAGIQHYTNGVADPTPPLDEINDPIVNTGIEWALPYFLENPLVAIPGTRGEYSSFGYNLAGVVLEHALDAGYEDLVLQEIGHRVGMTTLSADRHWIELPDRAIGYRRLNGQLVRDGDDDVSWKLPGGGFISTVVDLARYCGGLTDDILVDELAREEDLWAPAVAGGTYGLGFNLRREGGRRLIHHSGRQQKVATDLRLYPDSGLCFVMMTNTTENNPADLNRRIEAAWRAPEGCSERPPIRRNGMQVEVGLTANGFVSAYRRLTDEGYRIIDVDAVTGQTGTYFNFVARADVPGPYMIRMNLTEAELLTEHDALQGMGLQLRSVESYLVGEGKRYLAIWYGDAVGQTIHPDLRPDELESLIRDERHPLRGLSAVHLNERLTYTAIEDPVIMPRQLVYGESLERYREILGQARRDGFGVRRIDWTSMLPDPPRFHAEFSSEIGDSGVAGPIRCDALERSIHDAVDAGRRVERITSYERDGETFYSIEWARF